MIFLFIFGLLIWHKVIYWRYYHPMRKVRLTILSGIFLWVIFIIYALIARLDREVILIGVVGAALGIIGIIYSSRRAKKEDLAG